MKLNSAQLDAFSHIAQTLNFTKAAELLHITQSALSQRISKLEEELETTLFIRDRTSVKLTEMGYRLLRYCKLQEAAEGDLLAILKGSQKGLGGTLRIAGFSSINRSLVIPALKKIIMANDGLSIKLITREMLGLEDLLKRAEADYILTNRDHISNDVESVLLGHEKIFLVGLKNSKAKNIFIDHDESDEATHLYFKQNKLPYKPKTVRYLDDVYGLIDGVRNGYGQAVLPKHLIDGDKGLEILNEQKPLKLPIYLHFFYQPYYRPIHALVIEALTNYFRENLSS